MTKLMHSHCGGFLEGTSEEMSLVSFH